VASRRTFTYGALASYHNFILNANLWLLLGVLFRLPQLPAQSPQPVGPRTAASWMPACT